MADFHEIRNQKKLLSEQQVLAALRYHHLDTGGRPEVLRKRMSVHQARAAGHRTTTQVYQYLLVVDFEATCLEHNPLGFKHEIIEFPVVLFDVVTGKVTDKFHSYCRPLLNPQLSDFCTQLTKISQQTVDSAPNFSQVFHDFHQWLLKHRLSERSFAIVADCNADMAKFFRLQCQISGLAYPTWANYWINLRKTFRNFYSIPYEIKINLGCMLEYLGLEFSGQQHCGLDDALNVARVVQTLIHDGCELRYNEALDLSKPLFYRPVYKAEAQRLLCPESRLCQSAGSSPQMMRRWVAPESNPLEEETEETISDLLYLLHIKSQTPVTHI